MKWVGIFQVEFSGWEFSGGELSRGQFDGWGFSGGFTQKRFGNISKKYQSNFPLFILMSIFLQSLHNLKDQRFFAESSKLFTPSPKRLLDMIFISIRVRRKIRTLFLRKHAKLYHEGINRLSDIFTMQSERHFRFYYKCNRPRN